jgi:hypothetical protein
MNSHELIEEHLKTVSNCIHSRFPIPSPSFIESECYDKNLNEIYQQIMNAPHISQCRLPSLNVEIMTAISSQAKAIE